MPQFEHAHRRTLSNCLFSLFLFHDSDPVRFVARCWKYDINAWIAIS